MSQLYRRQTGSSDIAHRYYPDLDGLRAVAVVPVVLFHAGATWLPGGFVGVDVFFVLSEFFSTRQLIADIEAGRYSNEVLCGPEVCNIVRNGKPLYFDDNHIDMEVKRLLEPLIGSAMERLLWRANMNAGRAV